MCDNTSNTKMDNEDKRFRVKILNWNETCFTKKGMNTHCY